MTSIVGHRYIGSKKRGGRLPMTGYGKEGGLVDVEPAPELAGVGCKMCHGPVGGLP